MNAGGQNEKQVRETIEGDYNFTIDGLHMGKGHYFSFCPATNRSSHMQPCRLGPSAWQDKTGKGFQIGIETVDGFLQPGCLFRFDSQARSRLLLRCLRDAKVGAYIN